MHFKDLQQHEKQMLFGILKYKFDADKQKAADWLNSQKDASYTAAQWMKLASRIPSHQVTTEQIIAIEEAAKIFNGE